MSQQKKLAAAEFSSDVKRHMAQGQQPHGGEEDLVFEDPFGDDMEDEEMVAPNPDTMLPQQVDSDDEDWSSSSSDEEMNDVAVCVAAATQALAIREDYFCQQRVIWSDHVTVLRRRSSFERNYRLDEGSFDHLLELLRSDLQVDALISTVRTGKAPISAEPRFILSLPLQGG
ncbi:hypothetical protein PF002_g23154 [Phytophthora fragariae]|uniref:Uncharacterized protein n=1 Tax=Phytophthora fragariae TaxID=53985 RepID=A0A6A3S169_9STRA|nr:hypothetical protein PF011_g13085 [Phytophthora fragariae]KAE9107332.1 hypothetical protein PF006_g21140 [Phytophthora fragariae]KAE9196053.1 hypothetical protein PF002_g23154 [Phytophthora fragariae]KAE9280107.1 hypothetical protein PF001_g24387 [Phytophthora fragariae]